MCYLYKNHRYIPYPRAIQKKKITNQPIQKYSEINKRVAFAIFVVISQ